MTREHRFARYVFGSAGVYGLLVMAPQYWMEGAIGRQSPPAITHPEYFYGFVGVVLAWQLVFLLMARDPAGLRVLMPAAVLEKLAFGIPVLVLYAQHRLAASVLPFGVVDLVLCALFAASYVLTSPRRARARYAVAAGLEADRA